MLLNEYEFLDAVPFGTFEYWDRLVDQVQNYKYAVTTVVDGSESPLPEPADSN